MRRARLRTVLIFLLGGRMPAESFEEWVGVVEASLKGE
jgi:hypothetical protein